MKRYILHMAVISVFLLMAAPLAALAEDNPQYVVLKAGTYLPTGDLDNAEFDAGDNGEIAYGYRVNPSLALEGSVGYFQSESNVSGFYPVLGFFNEDDEITTTPITISAIYILPEEQVEVYVGAGVGLYFTTFERNLSSAPGTISVDDDDTVVGGHLMAGFNVEITPTVYFGVEGKYIFTDDAEFAFSVLGMPLTIETNLNGYTLTGNLGFRF